MKPYKWKPVLQLVALAAAWLCTPVAGLSDTQVFTYADFDWQGGSLRPAWIVYDLDLGFDAGNVSDVRARYRCTSSAGEGTCCQGADCWTDGCSASLRISFNESNVQATELFGQDLAEHTGDFHFARWVCDNGWPCWNEPLGEDPWVFLDDGNVRIVLEYWSRTFCGSHCSASAELLELSIEVDYDSDVPSDRMDWGALKASYR